MSKKARELGYNPFYTINELNISDDGKEMVLEYVAQLLIRLLGYSGDWDGHCKSYDPLVIDEGMRFLSYLFDARDGTRERTLKSYTDGEDWLMESFAEWLNRSDYRWESIEDKLKGN